MEVGGKRKDVVEKVAERAVEMIAGEFGMGCIQANSHVLLSAKLCNEVAVNKQVVEALPAEVPGEGGHRLGNDLHLACGVDLLQACNQSLPQRFPFAAVEVMVFGKTADVGHQQHRV